ncbi:MAG: glycosyltransferase [Eggerthellaceae bacterium]|nr:glycosyltransferase [Eggerthellaceae bacterium]
MSKVSIVLPTYNGEKYIRESINSVLSQTYEDWELIVIDDCSNDATPAIIQHFMEKDSRITSIRNLTNKKLPASLNIGFEHASGDYFTWTSDDNLFRNDALSIMVSTLGNNPNTDLVYCDIQRINAAGDIVSMKEFSPSPSFIYLYNVVQACFLYRSSIHRDLDGYDTSLFLVEDYDFWLRANRKHNIVHIKQNPYYYRMHDSSLSATREKEIRRRTCGILRRELCLPSQGIGKRLGSLVGIMYNYMRYIGTKSPKTN